MIASRMWPAAMLPNSRSDSDSARAKWLTISIGNISGASAGTGPAKCLRYFTKPCVRMPT